MDPAVLGAPDWQRIVVAVNYFWLFAACLIVAALSFGFAQAVLPSLVRTRHLPRTVGVTRPLLYLVSAVGFVLALIMAAQALIATGAIIGDYYPRWLI